MVATGSYRSEKGPDKIKPQPSDQAVRLITADGNSPAFGFDGQKIYGTKLRCQIDLMNRHCSTLVHIVTLAGKRPPGDSEVVFQNSAVYIAVNDPFYVRTKETAFCQPSFFIIARLAILLQAL